VAIHDGTDDYLYLFDTDLSELPDMSALTALRIFDVDQCKFTFEDFINTGLDFNSLEEVYYSNQDTLELKKDFLEYDKGAEVILNCRNLLREDLWSQDNRTDPPGAVYENAEKDFVNGSAHNKP